MSSAELLALGACLLLAAVAVAWHAIARRKNILWSRWTLVFALLMAACGTGVVAFAITNPARVTRDVANARLRELGQAIHAYVQDERGFPLNLRDLIRGGYITPELLQSPLSLHVSAGASDFVYVRGLPLDAPSDWPVVFEADSVQRGEGRAILFVSGVVRIVDPDEFSEILHQFEAAYEQRTGDAPAYEGHLP